MTLQNMGDASNEQKEQRKLQLKSDFNRLAVVTVNQAAKQFGYRKPTIIKWAKEANIPLIIDNQSTVVPMTANNRPTCLPVNTTPGDMFMAYLKQKG